MRRWALLIAVCSAFVAFMSGEALAVPVVFESGWTLSGSVDFANGQSAVYNPIDGSLYVGARGTSLDGIYRINADGTSTLIASGDRVAALAVDYRNGNLFFSEDYGGYIKRVAYGSTTSEVWVSAFDTGDDDPVGMAIDSNGNALVVDRGSGGVDEIWRFSADSAEGETEISGVDSVLTDPVDVAIGTSGTFLVDPDNDAIYRLNADDTLTELSLQTAIYDPMGICIDPLTGDLLVLSYSSNSLLRVDPETGMVSDLFTGFGDMGRGNWAGVDISPDGKNIFVTDKADGKIYTFSAVPLPAAFWLLATGLIGLIGIRRRTGR